MQDPMASSEHVDLLILAEVRELAQERFASLLANYLAGGFNLLSEIAIAVRDGREEDTAGLLRELGANSADLGLLPLAGLCTDMVRRTQAGRISELDRPLRALNREFALVAELLQEEILLHRECAAGPQFGQGGGADRPAIDHGQ